MTATQELPLFASKENVRVIGSMVTSSHRSPMTVEGVLNWEGPGVNKLLPPKMPTASWIYGTRFWDALTDEQRMELLWLENARDISMFIALEQYLPPIYMSYLIAFGDKLPPEVEEYMMIFSKEELVHTLMFRRYMSQAKLPRFVIPERPGYQPVMHMLEHSPKTTPPIIGVMWTLVIEWAAELNAMHGTQVDEVDPFTRAMFRAHHIDEVRHITFGKRIVEDFFATKSEEQKNYVRKLMGPAIKDVFNEFKFTEQICDMTSFKFPFSSDDGAAIQEVRESANNQRLQKERFGEMEAWLRELGILY